MMENVGVRLNKIQRGKCFRFVSVSLNNIILSNLFRILLNSVLHT